MNKIVKYVCIFIIILGLYLLFSGVKTHEGATNMNSGYGSNGVATKGYDGDGKAILDYNENGVPIVGYQGNHPILGKPAPAPATNIPQLGAVGDITGFNSDGTPIFDNSAASSIAQTPASQTQTVTSPAVSTNPAVSQSGPVKRFNF